jgi:hypothetical protein
LEGCALNNRIKHVIKPQKSISAAVQVALVLLTTSQISFADNLDLENLQELEIIRCDKAKSFSLPEKLGLKKNLKWENCADDRIIYHKASIALDARYHSKRSTDASFRQNAVAANGSSSENGTPYGASEIFSISKAKDMKNNKVDVVQGYEVLSK